jgi:hypothetical protein
VESKQFVHEVTFRQFLLSGQSRRPETFNVNGPTSAAQTIFNAAASQSALIMQLNDRSTGAVADLANRLAAQSPTSG